MCTSKSSNEKELNRIFVVIYVGMCVCAQVFATFCNKNIYYLSFYLKHIEHTHFQHVHV